MHSLFFPCMSLSVNNVVYLLKKEERKESRRVDAKNEFSMEAPERRCIADRDLSALSRSFARNSSLGGDFWACIIRQSGRLSKD